MLEVGFVRYFEKSFGNAKTVATAVSSRRLFGSRGWHDGGGIPQGDEEEEVDGVVLEG